MKHLLTLALVLCLGTFASAQVPSYVPTNGLVGWWPFNGNANDESGNNFNAIEKGATLTTDRYGIINSAYDFYNSTGGLEVDSFIFIDSNYSVSFWVNTNVPITNQARLISNDWSNCGEFVIYQNNPGTFCFATNQTCSSNVEVNNNILQLNKWYHIAGVRNNNNLTLYINGVLVSSNLNNNINGSAVNKLFFGGDPYQPGRGFWGKIDDIAIYNRALTAAEVQQLYLGNSSNTPAASTVPGKIHYQGLAVGANGKPIKNGTVGLRLSVLDSLPNGSNLYTETLSASTDAAGIFSTYLGGGTVTAGTFANIPWANGNNKFLKVEMDAQGGANYQNMGSTQLVSVPYALHAGSAQRATELMDSAGNAYQIKIVNGQPTLVSAPGNVSTPAPFACGQAVTFAGESYPTVQIGSQCWFQKNVNAGSMVLGANDQTNNGILEKYCYNNDPANCSIYGGLYQWAEAVQYQNGASNTASPSPAFTGNIKGICPTGWHVPSDGEYCTLSTFLDATVNCGTIGWSGTNAGGKMKSVSGLWAPTNVGATNSSGFSALPGGDRITNGAFYNVGFGTNFWSSSESSSTSAIYRGLNWNDSNIYREGLNKYKGFSARCLKD